MPLAFQRPDTNCMLASWHDLSSNASPVLGARDAHPEAVPWAESRPSEHRRIRQKSSRTRFANQDLVKMGNPVPRIRVTGCKALHRHPTDGLKDGPPNFSISRAMRSLNSSERP